MSGDSTLFTRADAVLAGWEFVDPILTIWEENENISLYSFTSGTWGPEEAETLYDNPVLKWHDPLTRFQSDEDKFCK